MQDVADVCGVSLMTVSNAFNRPDQLSPALRKRILERASKMGYLGPHAAARALKRGRTNAFGVVFAGSARHAFSDSFTRQWLIAFADALEPTRSSVVLVPAPCRGDAEVLRISNTPVDALVSMTSAPHVVGAAHGLGVPLVLGEPVGDCFVAINERQAGRDLAQHVVDLGHRDVWIMSGHRRGQPAGLHLSTAGAAEDALAAGALRLAGVMDVLVDPNTPLVMASGWDRDDGAAAAELLFTFEQRPSCVIALNDNLALGILDTMRRRGLVPGTDLSVAGFDDITEAAAAGLTTIHQPIDERARTAAKILLDPDQPRQVLLEHRLVERTSTQPPIGPGGT